MTSSGQKVLVSGVSGYFGTALCRQLEQRSWCRQIVGFDVKPPLYKFDKLEFRKMSINDPQLASWVKEVAPDLIIHLAFIVDPIADEQLMFHVNVEGSQNLLAAAENAAVRQVLIASSGTAYGAWPDNPVPLKESDPLRPHPTFAYANHKSQVESICEAFGAKHPNTVLSIVRPCVVYGPLVNNYLSDLLTGLPWVTGLAGYDPPLQFVHEDDVTAAIATIAEQGAKGAFNVAPPDTLLMSEVLNQCNKPMLQLPDWVLRPVVGLCWRLGIPLLKAPPTILDFFRFPWVMDSSRLRQELGFTFRYSSRETLAVMLRAKGLQAS